MVIIASLLSPDVFHCYLLLTVIRQQINYEKEFLAIHMTKDKKTALKVAFREVFFSPAKGGICQ